MCVCVCVCEAGRGKGVCVCVGGGRGGLCMCEYVVRLCVEWEGVYDMYVGLGHVCFQFVNDLYNY